MAVLRSAKYMSQCMVLVLALSSTGARAGTEKLLWDGRVCDGVVKAGAEVFLLAGVLPMGQGKGCVEMSGAGTEVLVSLLGQDRYRQEAARIRDADGKSLSARLVEKGFGVFKPDSRLPKKEVQALLGAEDDARSKGSGVWLEGVSVLPADKDVPVGRYALVAGVVQKAVKGRDEAFLDFGEDYKTDFTVVVPKRLWKSVGDIEALAGARVEVRGYVVSRYGPQIMLSSPQAMRILSGPENPSP